MIHYLIEIPEERLDELREAVRALDPQAPGPTEIVMGEAGRTAHLDQVEQFYDGGLRRHCPDTLRPWAELEPHTRRVIASVLADNREYQFADAYRVEWDEIKDSIAGACPEAVKEENQ